MKILMRFRVRYIIIAETISNYFYKKIWMSLDRIKNFVYKCDAQQILKQVGVYVRADLQK